MCMVSGVMDYGFERWRRPPEFLPVESPGVLFPTQAEINEFRKLLEAAREFDRKTNQPDCELAAKKERLRDLLQDIAEECGFDIDITFLD